jgi:hypothetical protein
MKPRLTFARSSLAMLAALLAITTGCATRPAVHAGQDPDVDLKAYKTFAFYEPASPVYMSLAEKHLRTSAREQLERRQYTYDEREPELRVNYALQVVDKQELRSTQGSGRFGYRGWGNGGVESVEYRQGMLAIDLVDTRRNTLVWRAVAEGRLDSKAMEQPGPAIDAVVSDMFTRLPAAAP